MNNAALQTQNLNLQVGNKAILQGIDCHIPVGQFSAIIGPNGAGKSSLMRCLAGLQTGQGQVLLQGQSIASLSPRQRAQGMAYLAQNDGGNTLDELRVQDIVMLGRLPHQGLLSPGRPADAEAVDAALQATGSAHLRQRLFAQLSGGERQKVLLARALAVQAPLLLMDEPLNHLDPPHQSDWLRLVRQLTQQGQTVVAVLHDINYALRADHVLVLAAGRLQHQGSSQDAATHRAIEAVFEQRLRMVQVEGRWLALHDL